MPFEFITCDLPGLVIVTPKVFGDDRGFFLETYKKTDFAKNGIDADFYQDNHSLSAKHVLRGLHFQISPAAQAKLVRVVRGAAWDVAVDIRRDSASFKKWFSIELSEANQTMLYIPEGFAHGFVALTDDTHLMYKCSREYSPEHDAGIIWNDPEIGIDWPVDNPLLSGKDKVLPKLKDAVIY